MTIEVGETYRFAHKPFAVFDPGSGELTEWSKGYQQHSGQSVCVTGSSPCMGGTVYLIHAADGWRGTAFADELEALPESIAA